MKILITGGCGFVGSNIAVFLKKNMKNVRISSLDNLERQGSKLNEKRLKKINIKNYRIDINNHKTLLSLVRCCAFVLFRTLQCMRNFSYYLIICTALAMGL